ncbi:hypothetical protein LEMLEM_LOCUS2480, partial [Lemmus lemmus]
GPRWTSAASLYSASANLDQPLANLLAKQTQEVQGRNQPTREQSCTPPLSSDRGGKQGGLKRPITLPSRPHFCLPLEVHPSRTHPTGLGHLETCPGTQ